MTSDVKMVIYCGGAFRCSLNLSPNVLDDFPVYSLSHLHPIAFVSVDDTTLLCNGTLIFGSHQKGFDGITSFTIHLYPMFSEYIFQDFTWAL